MTNDPGVTQPPLFCKTREGPTAAAQHIPQELLLIIFAYLAEDLDPSLEMPPYTVGHVSRQWRAATVGVPELWCTLPVISMAERTSPSVHAVEAYIRKLPPESSISFSAVNPRFYDHPALAHLMTYRQRWQKVHLELCPSFIGGLRDATFELQPQLRRYIDDPCLPVPRLRTLKLKIVPEPSFRGQVAAILGANPCCYDLLTFSGQSCPQLTNVELECLDPHSYTIYLPWVQLKRYATITKGTPVMWTLLRIHVCSEWLEDFTYIFQASTFVNLHAAEVIFKNLKRLDYRVNSTSWYHCPFLGCLILPALQTLRVRDYADNVISEMSALILRSGCNLTKVSFHTRALKPGELVLFLRQTPSIMELDCNCIPLADLDAFYATKSDSHLVPCLRSLTVHCPRADLRTRELAKVIRFRSDADRLLQHMDRLSHSRLVFPTSEDCVDALALLEGWPVSDDTQSRKLKTLAVSLNSKLATWHTHKQKQPAGRQTLNASQILSGIDKILTAIERETGAAANIRVCIMISGIHISVRRLLSMDTEDILCDRFQLFARGKRLLALWAPLLSQDRGWVQEGNHSLLHAKASDGGEVTQEEFLFGKVQSIPDNELLWYQQNLFR